MRYEPAATVRWVDHGETLLLLCLSSSRYLGCNNSARLIWNSLVSGRTELETAEILAREFALDPRAAIADVARFVELCQKSGLLTSVGAPLPWASGERSRLVPIRPQKPSFRLALAAILHVRLSLRLRGLAKAYQAASDLCERSGAGSQPPPSVLRRALTVFVAAEGCLPTRRGHNDCLARSLALFRLLRLAGVPVSHHIGVTRRPFQAHAWVSLAGEALLNDQHYVRQYVPIATLPLKPK